MTPTGPHTTDVTDVLVLGGGMAGVSVGAELATDRRVTVLDQEATFAFHTTGRSAAMFLTAYGGPVIRTLTVTSRALSDELDLLTPLPNLNIGLLGHGDAIRAMYDATRELAPDIELLTAEEAVRLQPLLRPGRIELALLEPSAQAIDVHGLHQHYLRALRSHGGLARVSARVVSASRTDGVWTVVDAAGARWQAPTVVNAAGAWADEVAALFGGVRVGLRPLRRTAFLVDAPPGSGPPMIGDVPDTFYVKPDAGRLLCSPADETRQAPADARPDELAIARAIETINEVTTLDVRHVRAAWAGLRSFVLDRAPVVGADPRSTGCSGWPGRAGTASRPRRPWPAPRPPSCAVRRYRPTSARSASTHATSRRTVQGCPRGPRRCNTARMIRRSARAVVVVAVLTASLALPSFDAAATTPRQRLTALLNQRSKSASSVSIVDVTARRTLTVGSASGMVTASIVKLELLETVLVIAQSRHRGLTAAERRHLVPMIEHSSNADADWVSTHVGGRPGVGGWEHKLGLRRSVTVIGTQGHWGLTTTNAGQQIALLHNLVDAHSPLTAANRAYALHLMRSVERDQRWGVPPLATSGTPANKNGWVNIVHDHNYWAVNSIGVVTVRKHQLLVAVLTQHNHGFAAGKRRVAQLARAAVAAEQAG